VVWASPWYGFTSFAHTSWGSVEGNATPFPPVANALNPMFSAPTMSLSRIQPLLSLASLSLILITLPSDPAHPHNTDHSRGVGGLRLVKGILARGIALIYRFNTRRFCPRILASFEALHVGYPMPHPLSATLLRILSLSL